MTYLSLVHNCKKVFHLNHAHEEEGNAAEIDGGPIISTIGDATTNPNPQQPAPRVSVTRQH